MVESYSYRDDLDGRRRWEDEQGDTTSLADAFGDLVGYLAPVDQDLLLLRANGAKQGELGREFGGITQAGMSYRLKRILQRLVWLKSRPPRPESFEDDVREAARSTQLQRLVGYRRLPEPQRSIEEAKRIERILQMVLILDRTTCQSATSREIGISQAEIRRALHRLYRILVAQGHSESFLYLQHLEGHWGILRSQYRYQRGQSAGCP